MGAAPQSCRLAQKQGGALGDPGHGEKVVSTMVKFFLVPLALLVRGRR